MHDGAEIGAFPALLGQQVMHAGERHQPAFEAFLGVLHRLGVPEGLVDDGLNGRQGVLDPVIQLMDQQALVVQRTLVIRDVDALVDLMTVLKPRK